MRVSPPPIRTLPIEDDKYFCREWQKWFMDFVKTFQETQILIYKQNDAPTIPSGYNFALWQDTNGGNKCYFMYKRGDADQVKVELTT